MKIYFPEDDPGFSTHFPGVPTVPGSMLTMALVRMVEERFGGVTLVRSMSFRNRLLPGVCEATIEKDGSLVKCEVFQGEKLAARGTLLLRNHEYRR